MSKSAGILASVLVLGLMAACGQRENPLPGTRVDLRAGTDGSGSDPAAVPRDVPFRAPATVTNANWTHRAGSAQNTPIHPMLRSQPSLAWSADIGDREGNRHRISSAPVVANGRIFTLDSKSRVTSVSTSGAELWSRSLTPATDRAEDAGGGGVSTDGARVYVTTGFGRLTALDARNGATLWEQRLGAAATAAPTVADGVVYAVGNDSHSWAIDAETGRIIWDVGGTPSTSGLLGSAGPVVTDRLILLPSSSAEIVSVLKLSGLRVWAAPISGQRRGRAYARITDVTGDPIVVGDRIFAGNPSGRTVALDIASGERIWTAEEGAMGPLQVAGGSIFQVTDQNELVRLDAETGARIWGVQLPYFTTERVRRRRDITAHYGPILAGGRLYVASGDESLRVFDPARGQLVATIPLPGGAAAQPAVAGGTLYVVTSKGQLLAFR